MSRVKIIKVSEDDDGQRLDRWLKKTIPDIPYGLAQKLIRKGQLRVDGKRVKPDTKLTAGQDVRIPPVEDKPKDKKTGISERDAAFIKSIVIYDDGDVIAINKPAGLATQGGTSTKKHVDGMLDALKGPDGVRPRLVHRLDKDTSGVLLLARSAKVAKSLGDLFKGKDIKKIYYAVLSPAPENFEGTIRAPLIKAGGGNKERMIVDESAGKKSYTDYVVIENTGKNAAFVAFWPRTGRTHQIRAHAEVIGCPILGDRKYSGAHNPAPKQHGSGSDIVRGREGLESIEFADRLHLHAARIICRHPVRTGKLDIYAPLPPDLLKSWKSLGFNGNYKADPFADSEL